MIFNWNYGIDLCLELVSKTFAGIDSDSSLEMPLTLSPIAILLRTSTEESSELCVYYRTDMAENYTMRAGSEDGARTRLAQEKETHLLLACTGAAAARPATVECIILGVKK